MELARPASKHCPPGSRLWPCSAPASISGPQCEHVSSSLVMMGCKITTRFVHPDIACCRAAHLPTSRGSDHGGEHAKFRWWPAPWVAHGHIFWRSTPASIVGQHTEVALSARRSPVCPTVTYRRYGDQRPLSIDAAPALTFRRFAVQTQPGELSLGVHDILKCRCSPACRPCRAATCSAAAGAASKPRLFCHVSLWRLTSVPDMLLRLP